MSKICWNPAPSAKQLASKIPVSVTEDELAGHASAVLRECNVKHVASTLNTLASIYCRNNDGTVDTQIVQNQKNTAARSVCGMVFKKGDIVWTCTECGKDPTCVQCDSCFRDSDHEGHEVFFHRASGGGGCCDCGDSEAWAECGNCTAHKKKDASSDEDNSKDIFKDASMNDPSKALPPHLVRGLQAVLKGVMGVLVTYICGYVRGFQTWSSNEYAMSELWPPSTKLRGILHNDDRHTYDDVTKALVACGVSSSVAAEITESVDRDGQRRVVETDVCSMKGFCSGFCIRSLLFTIVPVEIDDLSPKLHAVFLWLITVAQFHDGIRRVIVNALLMDVSQIPAECTALGSLACNNTNANDSANSSKTSINACNIRGIESLSLAEIFTNPVQFPNYLPGMYNFCGTPNCPRAPLLYPFEFEWNRYTNPYDKAYSGNALSMLILGSPYLPKVLQVDLSESLVVTYQHDVYFKYAYSQLLTLYFPCLYGLYMRGIGTENESIFNTTVQVYTADSVVDVMSSLSTDKRYFNENEAGHSPVHITSLLIQSLIACFVDLKCAPRSLQFSQGVCFSNELLCDHQNKFLEHHSIMNRRFWKLIRCIEYVTTTSTIAVQTLAGERDPSSVGDWLHACTMLQQLYLTKRETVSHVSQETNHWQVAMNLMLEVDGISSHWLGNALFSTPSLHISENSPYLKNSYLENAAITAFVQCFGFIKSYLETAEFGNLFTNREVVHTVLGFDVRLPCFLNACISTGYTSISIPLHRFAGKLIYFACCSGLNVTSIIEHCKNDLVGSFALMEYPLQVMSFVAQGVCDMWRRNGISVVNMVYNYERAPLCCALRDVDLVALQTGIIALGGDASLTMLKTRFEVDFSLHNNDPLIEYKGDLLAQMLRLIILCVTQTPVVLTCTDKDTNAAGDPEEGLVLGLRREIIHVILSGCKNIGQVQSKCKRLLGTNGTVTEALVRKIVTDICVQKQVPPTNNNSLEQAPQSISLDLFPVELDYFDPEQYHLSNAEKQKALERVREHRKKEIASASSVVASEVVLRRRLPIICSVALPIPHPNFIPLRNEFLFTPLLSTMLAHSLLLCVSDKKNTKKASKFILSRALHLVTLQVHCSANSAINTSIGCLLYFTEAFDAFCSQPSNRLRGNIRRLFPDSITYGAISDQINEDVAAETQYSFCDAFCGLFLALVSVYKNGIVEEDDFYFEGFQWIFQELSDKSNVVKQYLEKSVEGLNFASVEVIQSALKQQQLEKRLKAQARMKSKITQLASAFVVPDYSDEEDDDSDQLGNTDETARGVSVLDMEDGIGEELCIICRDKKPNQAIGYLAYLQPSAVVRQAIDQNPDCPKLNDVYRVAAISGCSVYSSPSLSQRNVTKSFLLKLSQGDHVLSDRRVGIWLHIVAPVVGWCTVYQTTNGKLNKKTGKGEGGKVPYLVRVKNLQHNVFGAARMHVSTCAHMVHFGCYDVFYSTCLQQSFSNFMHDEIVDIRNRNLLCPLCKGITNTLLPYTPKQFVKKLFGSNENNLCVPCGTNSEKEVDESTKSHQTASEFQYPPKSTIKCQSNERDGEALLSVWNSMLGHDCNDCDSVEFKLSSQSQLFSECCVERGTLLKYAGTSEAMLLKEGSQYSPTWEKDHLGVKVVLSKDLYGLWTSAAYTLLSATCCDRWLPKLVSGGSATSSSSRSNIGPETRKANHLVIKNLVLASRQAPSWFAKFDPAMFSQLIRNPLINMLFPGELKGAMKRKSKSFRILDSLTFASGPHADYCEDIHLFLPAETVTTNQFPDNMRVGRILEILQRVKPAAVSSSGDSSTFNKNEPCGGVFEKCGGFDSCANPMTYPVFSKPLLAQDLHSIAMGVVGISTTIADGCYMLQYLCIARLCQLLIEPAAIGVIDCPATAIAAAGVGELYDNLQLESHSDVPTDNYPHKKQKLGDGEERLVELFCDMRISLIKSAALVNHEDIVSHAQVLPEGVFLLKLVSDSWLPYLQYTEALMDALSLVNEAQSCSSLEESSVSSNTDEECLVAVLERIGLKSFLQLDGNGTESATSVVSIAHQLGEAYGAMYCPLSSESESELSGSSKVDREDIYKYGDYIPVKYSDEVISKMKERWSMYGAMSSSINDVPDSSNVVMEGSMEGSMNLAVPLESQAVYAQATPHEWSNEYSGGAGSDNEDEDLEGEDEDLEEEDEDLEGEEDNSAMEEEYQAYLDAGGELMDNEGEYEGEGYMDYDDDEWTGLEAVEYSEDVYENADGDVDSEDSDADGEKSPDDAALDGVSDVAIIGCDVASKDRYVNSVVKHHLINTAAAAISTSAGSDVDTSGVSCTDIEVGGLDPSFPAIDEYTDDMFNTTVTVSPNMTTKAYAISCLHSHTPFQGSVSGTYIIHGVNGESLSNNNGYNDLSHLGLGSRHVGGLIPLPRLYTDVYQRAKFPLGRKGPVIEEPAICLVCGMLVAAGSKKKGRGVRLQSGAGDCTLHAETCGAGSGVFFLVQKCCPLLISGSRSCYLPPIYMDKNGETDDTLVHSKPMFLSKRNYDKLQELYLKHECSKELCRIRANARQVIRQNWY